MLIYCDSDNLEGKQTDRQRYSMRPSRTYNNQEFSPPSPRQKLSTTLLYFWPGSDTMLFMSNNIGCMCVDVMLRFQGCTVHIPRSLRNMVFLFLSSPLLFPRGEVHNAWPHQILKTNHERALLHLQTQERSKKEKQKKMVKTWNWRELHNWATEDQLTF